VAFKRGKEKEEEEENELRKILSHFKSGLMLLLLYVHPFFARGSGGHEDKSKT